ncbi:sensor histidine kinase [Luteimonas sp. RIT-PG2_3]
MILLAIGVLVPAMVAWEALMRGVPVRQHWPSLLAAVAVWLGIFAVRQGYFRLTAYLTLLGALALIGHSYLEYGLRAQSGLQVTHLVPLLFAGLLLGRFAVWATMALMLLAMSLGAWVDLGSGQEQAGWQAAWQGAWPASWQATLQGDVVSNLTVSILSFLVVAAILDRLIAASQRARLRSLKLDMVCDQLEDEIEENARTHAQLLHAQRIETVGRLASGVAHDFNNILAIIVGYASVPRMTGDGNDALRSLVGIELAAKRGEALTRRLLTLSRSDDRNTSVFDAAASLQDTWPLLAQLFGADIETELELPATPLWVELDRAEFELAVLNIASNARDAMPDGGTFRICADAVARGIRIVFVDNGCGMSEDVAQRIFEPFFTTKSSASGTGIGLAVVERTIIEAGGDITVQSVPGMGTGLEILLPAAAPSAPAVDV